MMAFGGRDGIQKNPLPSYRPGGKQQLPSDPPQQVDEDQQGGHAMNHHGILPFTRAPGGIRHAYVQALQFVFSR